MRGSLDLVLKYVRFGFLIKEQKYGGKEMQNWGNGIWAEGS